MMAIALDLSKKKYVVRYSYSIVPNNTPYVLKFRHDLTKYQKKNQNVNYA